jgi:hypothetical protein
MSKSDDRRLLLMAVRMPIPLEEASLQLDADVEVLFLVELAVRVLHSTKRMLHHEAVSSHVVASPAMSLPLLAVVEAKSYELFSHRSSSIPQHSSLKVSRLASRRLGSKLYRRPSDPETIMAMCTSLGKVFSAFSLLSHVISA